MAELNPYAHDAEERQKQLKVLEQMERDLFTIQCDGKGSNKWEKGFHARVAVGELKHHVMTELGLR